MTPEAEAVRTTCAYCGVGCGIVATRESERNARIEGDRDHPANEGRLCSKGVNLGETLSLEGRLLHPLIGSKRANWDKALNLVARRFVETVERHGPDSVAFYVSGQLLTEDYYVANKLMKGVIGSANIDTNSRLCMSSAVAGHIRAFGEDVVPASYEDLDVADLIVLVGSNTAWCHPIVYRRIQAARQTRGTRLVVIDPRRTETCEEADLHLPLRPGSDVALQNGLLAHCLRRGVVDRDFIAAHVDVPDGFWEGLAKDSDVEAVAGSCDVDPESLQTFFDWFAATPRTVTLFSQGINQSVSGTDQVNAILNLHLATGRIGKPGAAPFSITGQPNAMGGREVGGLASTLAAHMDFAPDNVARVRRFWGLPQAASKPGLKAVDMFRQLGTGRIKAIWIMATNPAVSMPDAAAVREALAACPFVVVSDCIADTDTSRLAHVRLPALAWGEKDGTVTNSERVISRQRPFLEPPGEARPDWWIIAQAGSRMGAPDAFPYRGPADIYREHARLSAYENDGRRLFDIGRHAGITNAAYDAMRPWRWGGRPFADGRFATPDGRARLVPVVQRPLASPLARFPMTLNTGRYRDQWHSMTRTGLSPRLARHRGEPSVELHPADAQALAVTAGDLVRVTTPQGESLFRAEMSEGQRRGEAFVPIHWTDRQSTAGRTGFLPRPKVDPYSGQPGFKLTPAHLQKMPVDWQGFLLSRSPVDEVDALYATRIRVPGGWLVELAGNGRTNHLAARLPKGERIELYDRARGQWRLAILDGGRLSAALFLTRNGRLPARDWLIGQLAAPAADTPMALLAGRPPLAHSHQGPVICGCFDVCHAAVVAAVRSHTPATVDGIGAQLRAGTNCGSCRPAIQRLINEEIARSAA